MRGECAPQRAKCTRTCIPLHAFVRVHPYRDVCTETARMGGLTLSLLCIYWKSVREKVRDAWGILYTPAWLELQSKVAKVTGKKL